MTTINFSKVLYVVEEEHDCNFIYYKYYFSEKDYTIDLKKETYDSYLKYVNAMNKQPFETINIIQQLISKIDDIFQFFVGKQSFENNFISDNK